MGEAQHALSELRAVRDRVAGRRRRRLLKLVTLAGAVGGAVWILRDEEKRQRATEYVSRARRALTRTGPSDENGNVAAELEQKSLAGVTTADAKSAPTPGLATPRNG